MQGTATAVMGTHSSGGRLMRFESLAQLQQAFKEHLLATSKSEPTSSGASPAAPAPPSSSSTPSVSAQEGGITQGSKIVVVSPIDDLLERLKALELQFGPTTVGLEVIFTTEVDSI